MEFTKEKKETIERSIVDASISALEQGIVTEDELGTISRFVLEKIDMIKTEDELLVFLQELSTKWTFFKSLYRIQQGEGREEGEQKVVKQTEALIKNGQIDEALDAIRAGGGI